ncbi:Apoptosis regulator BAX, partial [Ophiophagus hannah]
MLLGTSSDQILQTGTILLKSFIRDRVQCCGDSERIEVTMAELEDAEAQACNSNTKSLSECLRRIGDELDGNTELQRMIEQVQMYPPKEVFFRVAAEMFSDGAFNWGRVVALFYFACKLVLKVRRPPLLFRHPYLANHCCLCCGGLDCLTDLLEDVLILSPLLKEDLFITRTIGSFFHFHRQRKLLCKGGRSSSPGFRHGCGGKREEPADGLSCDSRGSEFIKTLWQRYAACSPHPDFLEQVGRDSMPGEQANEEDEPDAAQVYSLKEHMFRILQELRNNADITRNVIDWAMNFLRDRLALWIEQQGGWELSYSNIWKAMASPEDPMTWKSPAPNQNKTVC